MRHFGVLPIPIPLEWIGANPTCSGKKSEENTGHLTCTPTMGIYGNRVATNGLFALLVEIQEVL